jgi:hypothetical protein
VIFLKLKELIFGKFCTPKKREFVTNCCSFSFFEEVEVRGKNTRGTPKGVKGSLVGVGVVGATPVIFQNSRQVSIGWFDIATTFHAPQLPIAIPSHILVHSTKSTYQRTENLTL